MRYIVNIIAVVIIIVGFTFSGYYIRHDEMVHDPRAGNKRLCEILKEQMEVIAQHLKSYYTQNNHYPTNDEGLTVLNDLRKELAEKEHWLPPPMGTGINPEFYNRWHREEMVPFECGILSPMLEPFIYENRQGLSENIFADSPVNQDKERSYSLKVDEGIYLYSSSTLFYHNQYLEYRSDRIKHITYAILSALLVLIIGIGLIKAKKITKGILILVSIITGAYLTNLGYGTCYAADLFNLYERPDMINQYSALLEKYHERGVINDVTYQKTKTSIENLNKLIEDRKLH